MFDPVDRVGFVKLALLFEGSLIPIAAGLAWLWPVATSRDPFYSGGWVLTPESIGWGIAGALPLFGLFLLFDRYPVGPLREIRRFLIEALGPSLCALRWYDLILIAALAGFCEELLFRGALHPRLGLWWSNVVFGLVHAITPAYAVIAGVLGVYLGALFDTAGNLWSPMIAHGLYDYLAFLAVIRICRRNINSEQKFTLEDDYNLPDRTDSA